jgi:acyl-CoA reductase-like NAD-dependent aldehyde dehydrogenase
MVLKPSEVAPLNAILFAEILDAAGVPAGVFNLVNGDGVNVGAPLSAHPDIDMMSFTGSTRAGIEVARAAAPTVKRVSQELGGKSANIVLDDADLDLAAAGVLWGTFFHNGQVCESGTRALVSRKIYDEFVGMLVERAGKIVVGDNMDMATDQGPLVAPSQVDTTERYVKLGLDEGAKLLCGGSKPTDLPAGLDPNAYFQATIFEADNSMKIAQEEIFGPVLCVIPFDSDDEAIKIANDSIYGLGGGVWSTNLDRAHNVAAGMRTGTVWINDYHMINGNQPFGGYKQSGIGRELGDYGYNEYRQIKHVWQNTATDRSGYLHFAALSANI